MTSAELIEELTGIRHLDVEVLTKDEDDNFALYETPHEKPFFVFGKESRHISESRTDLSQLQVLDMNLLWFILENVQEYVQTPLRNRGNDKFFVVQFCRNANTADYLEKIGRSVKSTCVSSLQSSFSESFLFTKAELMLRNPDYALFAKPVDSQGKLI